MGRRGIHVEIDIAAPMERIWTLTQDTDLHPRWDVRFSRITPTETDASGARRFTYERATPLHTVTGTGISLGERRRPDGSRTSALRFSTRDRLSPIRGGRGYWRYLPLPDGRVRFVTGYDYDAGWGPLDILVRPLIGWATAWSFDRLRIWAETGVPPERWPLGTVLVWWRSDRPRAARCGRRPAGRDALDGAPDTLATLREPS
ncbi:SRPBCC family protein [Microbacterium sp. NPDC077663]|uniref:SRPBCC family protein n=1 Tax=Microbacterium sp. NPDC077663 TaxID=3364189 RepID=UPI0037CC63AA